MKTRLVSSVLLSLTLLASAADLPEAALPQGVGVNIHFTRGHEQDLDLIAAGGFRFIRMDFSWGGTERVQGQYDWSAYDELTANLEKRGLRALYILDYSNGLYEETVNSRDPISGQERRETASPQKPESVAAFARWAAAAARQFRGRRVIWEIWNEPNISFWKPKPDVKQYIGLALATCRAVREADPRATIVAPATSGFPWAFFEEFFKSGVLAELDAVSVHPYRGYEQGPETTWPDYDRLRGLIVRYAPPGKRTMPILSGEWGYATHAKGVSLETQAGFITRQQLGNLAQGVPLSIWYDWKNDGTDPNYNEHNFGTVTHELRPKPSYLAVQTMTRQLAGYRAVRFLGEHVLLLVNTNGDQKLAAWSSGEPMEKELDLQLRAKDACSAVDLSGQPRAVEVQDGKLRLRLGPAPQFITLKERSPVLAAAAAWSVETPDPLVEAGRKDGLQLLVRLRNPLSAPAQAVVTLALPGEAEPQREEVSLQTGESRDYLQRATLVQRYPGRAIARVNVRFQERAGSAGTIAVEGAEAALSVHLSNPLVLEVAPVEKGLRLHASSPTGAPFAGKAVGAGKGTAVLLDRSQPEMFVLLDLSPQELQSLRAVELLDEQGRRVGTVPVHRCEPLAVPQYRAVLDGDAKVPAQASLAWTNAPGGDTAPAARAFRLTYDFEAGWRFVRCQPQDMDSPAIPGRPNALGLWVHGDNSGNVLRMRVTDESGQTFQPNGPEVDWTGWRWVSFDLVRMKSAGHWGGANDGQVHGKLKLDCPLLLDGRSAKTSGTLWFAAPHWVYPLAQPTS